MGLAALVGCSSVQVDDVAVADASTDAAPDRGSDDAGTVITARDASVPDAPASVDAAGLDPLCNGDLRSSECEALYLPSAYGVDPACESPPFRKAGGTVIIRPDGLAKCVDFEVLATKQRVTCCPE